MKKIFSLAVIMIVICTSLSQLNAQSSTQVATLKHDSTLTVFYGKYAFVNAYNAADTGDVITLSKGSFYSTNISKKLTIRGAGMDTVGTLINDGPQTRIYADSLTLEGLYFDDLYIESDCYISMAHVAADYFRPSNATNNVVHGMLANCRINIDRFSDRSVITYVNSFILGSQNSSLNNFINCIVYGYGLQGYYENCILISSSNTLFTDNTTTSNNCVAFRSSGTGLSTGYGTHTNLRMVTSSIFQNFQTIGSDLSFQSFELTESAKTTYLGGDSTQVGWYGGYVPFTQYSTPRISNLSVSRSTTTDGQLSVSVTIDDGTTNNDEE